jgi:hypothetical protein
VQRYLAPPPPPPPQPISTSLEIIHVQTGQNAVHRTLEAIYLDTACLLSPHSLDGAAPPSKADAVAGLVKLMALYPPTTKFFLNTWTWGYEEVLKGVASAFGSLVRMGPSSISYSSSLILHSYSFFFLHLSCFILALAFYLVFGHFFVELHTFQCCLYCLYANMLIFVLDPRRPLQTHDLHRPQHR